MNRVGKTQAYILSLVLKQAWEGRKISCFLVPILTWTKPRKARPPLGVITGVRNDVWSEGGKLPRTFRPYNSPRCLLLLVISLSRDHLDVFLSFSRPLNHHPNLRRKPPGPVPWFSLVTSAEVSTTTGRGLHSHFPDLDSCITKPNTKVLDPRNRISLTGFT